MTVKSLISGLNDVLMHIAGICMLFLLTILHMHNKWDKNVKLLLREKEHILRVYLLKT